MKPIAKQIDIKLDDAFHGKMAHVKVDRQVVCNTCHGKGGENVKQCSPCKGNGVVLKTLQLGPGMYT